jgi:hypothetical protein
MRSISFSGRGVPLTLAFASLLALLTAAPALATHDTPLAAGTTQSTTPPDTPILVPLVPEYRQCGTTGNPANTSEGAPLAFPACAPPALISPIARQGPNSVATAKLQTQLAPPDQLIEFHASDVRESTRTADYPSNLTLLFRERITDHGCNPGTVPCTKVDFVFAIPIPCVATVGPNGSDCNLVTTFNSNIPGAIVSGKQMVIDTFRLRTNNAGADGVAGNSDDRPFLMQGAFFP